MTDLAEFLLARYSEAVEALTWQGRPPLPSNAPYPWRPTTIQAGGTALADPAWLVADYEAKRRIVERHKPYQRPIGLGCAVCLGSAVGDRSAYFPGWPCPDLRDLALPYVHHPDYREEWKP